MGIREGLKEEGYVFEYSYDEGGDRTEVWTNRNAGKAVRIEWLEINRADPQAGRLD
jgi:hypothetical protein